MSRRPVLECDACGLPASMDANGTVACPSCGRHQRAARSSYRGETLSAGLLGFGDDGVEGEVRALNAALGACDV